MGLLAAIFAYLSAVAAIIVFFLMSADALLYHSHDHATNRRSEIMTVARADPLKMAAPRRSHGAAEVRTIPQRSVAAEYRRKPALANMRFAEQRRPALRREAQARYWALHRERRAAPLALGYAEEPAAALGYGPSR